MNKNLWEAVGLIGDDLISAADESHVKEYFKQKKKYIWLKYAGVAACFVLAVCTILAFPSENDKLCGTEIRKHTNAFNNEGTDDVPPFEAQFEIVCSDGMLIFSRVATVPRIRAEIPSHNGKEITVKEFDDNQAVISALFLAIDGKKLTDAVEFTPCYRLLVYGQQDEEPWHYLVEIGTDGTARISNNGELLGFIQISENELRSILQALNN